MLRLTFILMLLLLKFHSFSQESFYDDSSGITIKFINERSMFPESWWNSSSINPEIEEIDSSEIKRSINCIIKGLRKYPKQVLSDNLQEVYVFKSIKFYDVKFGATYYQNKIFIANDGIVNGYSNYYLEKGLHHEFSSILYLKYPHFFDDTNWRKNSLIPYGKGGVNALKTKTSSQNFDSTLNLNGFLHQYACSSIENDINAFAENIFLPKNDFWNRTNKYKTLLNKRTLLIEFYQKLNSTLNEDYFKKFDTYGL